MRLGTNWNRIGKRRLVDNLDSDATILTPEDSDSSSSNYPEIAVISQTKLTTG